MPQFKVNGVQVDFPFPPYDCQKTYMSKVIECLLNRTNGILESPTGTGKTLCLLCATLAWREHIRNVKSAQKISTIVGDTKLGDTDLSSWCSTTAEIPTELPKIIYATRTHSQLAQVITELKNTSYRPKVSVLGSREQLCIHQEVQREESNHVKVHMCKRKVSSRSCIYYNNYEEKLTDRDLVHSILDVEDLVRFGNKERACPYYLSRSLMQQADIIFMPYNYLLDPTSRRAHNIALKGAVILFDEAHNLEKACEQQTSFDLMPYDLASAIDVVNRLLVELARDVSTGEVLSDSFTDSSSADKKLKLETVANVKQILIDLEAVIDSYDVSQDRGLTKPGSFIYELLARAHLTSKTKAVVGEALEQIIGHVTAQTGVFINTTGLHKLSDIIQLLFPAEPETPEEQQQQKEVRQTDTTFFKVHIHKDKSFHHKKANADVWSSSAAKKQGNILSYWCFSPGFSMQELVHQKVHCMVLTSGTLSPLSSFSSEMRIEFPVRLENSHVIDRDQIFVGVVPQGPDGVHLSSAFDRRFAPDNMSSLGNSIVNLSRVVPHGLLVFFPSFPLMEKTLEFWRAHGHAERIESLKPIFVEPKGKGTFTAVIDGYCNKVSDPNCGGGAFFAVCRGKVSEGLDFSDSLGRGVVITGLPFPPKLDPRVILKMQFLDESGFKKTPGIKYLSGQQWYRQQAFRAVNQAVGRVIRHRDDFGAIFLCDQRFKSVDAMSQLPAWIKPCVSLYDNFGTLVRDVSKFFRVAQKRIPVVRTVNAVNSVTPAETSKLPDQRSSGPTCSPLPSSSRSVSDAKVLDTHLLSTKRKRSNEPSRDGSGTARVCIRYEPEEPLSVKKPANLLDALVHSDLSSRKDQESNSWTGLSLPSGKRSDEDLQEGKRKISLVNDKQSSELEVVSGGSRVKTFLVEIKNTLSQVNFNQVMQALQSYKASDDLQALLAATAFLSEERSTHNLLRGIHSFVRPHHKEAFVEKFKELTVWSCGLQFAPSLAKDRARTQSLQARSEGPSSSVSIQLDSEQQLNHGRKHLNQHKLTNPEPGSSSKSHAFSSYIAGVKKTLKPSELSLLFQTIDHYKKNDDYEKMVTTVVGLFTEREENFHLLVGFRAFVRPQHKQQFEQMLKALRGPS